MPRYIALAHCVTCPPHRRSPGLIPRAFSFLAGSDINQLYRPSSTDLNH
ncbi:hypothetical protein HWC07_gp117 [Pantoea phage vB_PagM_LIET2]|uniref:Uncharacterized protein n=1 Tax=Pantoea phage vB_PagM_LIET2 TaxID=2508071 RepID=A0A411AWA9_9CAUD|nr:hypothetical protein HWC07_gp117 [Pantoea phage vB_PagM_LIET2]QAX92369.1 hypothetical protein LIET2_gp117 [Pantoea phage vB_PagM_LIET2]